MAKTLQEILDEGREPKDGEEIHCGNFSYIWDSEFDQVPEPICKAKSSCGFILLDMSTDEQFNVSKVIRNGRY